VITLAARVRPAKDVLHRDLVGESVLLDVVSGSYFGLDEVGTRIWALLAAGEPLDRIVAILATEYDATAERLCADLLALVEELYASRLVVVEEA
jgi:hypothetical protein